MPAERRPSTEPERLAALARLLHADPASVASLYEASAGFREIYSDFATCQEMLERFRQLDQVDDPRIVEYRHMRDELEAELRDYLEKATR